MQLKATLRGLFCVILWFLLGGHEGGRATRSHGCWHHLNGIRVQHSFRFQTSSLIQIKIKSSVWPFVLWVLVPLCFGVFLFFNSKGHMCSNFWSLPTTLLLNLSCHQTLWSKRSIVLKWYVCPLDPYRKSCSSKECRESQTTPPL